MEKKNANAEGAAYLSAVSTSEKFRPGEADFLPDRLAASVLRVTQVHDELEGHCEKLATEELQKEFSQSRKEMKNYLVVLKSILEIKNKDGEMWSAAAYFLNPQEEVATSPTMVKQQEVRKLLHRIAGFSTHSATIVDGLIKKRLDFETEKVRLAMDQHKKKPASGGFLSKLGIKF